MAKYLDPKADLTFKKISDRTEAEKYSIVDVCCKDNKQREFIGHRSHARAN